MCSSASALLITFFKFKYFLKVLLNLSWKRCKQQTAGSAKIATDETLNVEFLEHIIGSPVVPGRVSEIHLGISSLSNRQMYYVDTAWNY